jgi:hypothetical protein
MLFAANMFFQTHTGGYFDPSSDRMPLLHIWSLGVEEQFYLLWPLGLILMFRQRRMRPVTIVAICGLASLAVAEILMYVDPNAAFYLMPARFWELALGGLIAILPSRRIDDGRIPAAAGLLVVLAATALPFAHFPGIGALPAVLGAGLLLHAVHGSTRLGWAGALLRSRPMVFFGLISYSLYLWHWPLLALERATRPGDIPLVLRAATCAVAVVLAWMSYRWVEQPIRKPNPKITSRRVVVRGLMVSIATSILLFALGDVLDRPPSPRDFAARTEADQPSNRIDCHYRGDEPLSDFPRAACVVPAGEPVRVAIWGDSHALAWSPFAWAIAHQRGVAATSYTRDACGPALDWDNGKPPLQAQRCREFNALVASRIDSLDVLIFTAAWHDKDDGSNFYPQFEKTIARVSPRARKIILLGPTPYMRDTVPRCIVAHDLSACAVSRGEFDARTGNQRMMLKTIAARHPNIEYVELGDFFCDAKTCPPVRDGYGLYWDTNHVASSAVRAFATYYLAQRRP